MRCTYGENDFLIPSANPPNNRSQRPTSTCQGFLFTLLLGVGVFGVSTGVTRFFFPRGLSGQQGSSKPETNLLSGDEGRWKTWTDCATTIAGDPVLEGADLVSYFSLTDGQAAMYGTEQHEASYHGYTFWFVSEENKALFEADPVRYVPKWGGFCAYGIAEEQRVTKRALGPQVDPNSWVMLEGSLFFFRSEFPKSLFMENAELNVKLGEARWRAWWGDAMPAAMGKGSPLNTACFCNVETCLDL